LQVRSSLKLSQFKHPTTQPKVRASEDALMTAALDVQMRPKVEALSSMRRSADDSPQATRARMLSAHPQVCVVATYLKNLPNVAGLCRTAEIFGAQELAIASLKLKKDPAFKRISLSSESLLPLVEIPPHSLVQYLQEKKRDGYVVVAVEQTSQSVPLQDFVFPPKMVLLIGNEQEVSSSRPLCTTRLGTTHTHYSFSSLFFPSIS
jgi:tRNA G18 (ribose-2'-O)-methylase SpoU